MGRVAHPDSLLDQIERDVLNEHAPVAGVLRKCLALGGQSESEELRDWATVELQGYKDLELNPLPDYRIVPAQLTVDGFSASAVIKGQAISPSILPDFVQENVSNEVKFRQGIGELEALITDGEREGVIRIGLPMSSEIARLMNAELQSQYSSIDRIYWSVVPGAVRGITDQVRTALTQLVAELRATLPRGESVPSSEAVHQAIQVAVHGKRARVNVTTAQASEGASATVNAPRDHTESEFWTRGRKIGAFIVGLAGVAGAVFGAIQAF
jgi:hypothetical protein